MPPVSQPKRKSLPFISETGFAPPGTGTPYSTFHFDLHFRSTDAVPIFGPLLEPFLGGQFGVTFGIQTESKIKPFLDSLLMAIWRQLGRFLCWLGALLGGLVFQIHFKKIILNSNFQNRFFSLSWLLGMAFGCHVGSFWGGFGPQNEAQKH